ncbi:relicase [Bat associated circovirus 1]|uniref:Replication-associated protein n=1 Tax=Bat associated circovirus 1 TaxID=1868218 RepID=R4L1J0_9CIRC|nr:relicase [Bat associated circovirus 1]AGL09969.1 relicase [Bat associated circovirus 1]
MEMAGHPCERYCFTINNYSEEDIEAVKAFLVPDNAEYAIVGKEKGENGTPHLQGFVNLKKKMRFNPFKAALGGRAHIEQARGTDLDNKRYCSKGGDLLLEVGEPGKQGKRSDLKEAVTLLNSGANMTAVARAYPEVFIRYGRGLRDYVITAGLSQQRAWKTEVHVIVGVPGVGKSRHVSEQHSDIYWKPRGKWWDGYCNQEVVCLDDYYGWIPYDDLLRLCDRYPLRVETKGGTVSFVAKKIYITSNKQIKDWYNFEELKVDPRALYRRVTSYKVMREGGELYDVVMTGDNKINY